MTVLRKKIIIISSAVILLLSIAVFFVVKNANEILKMQLEKSLGKDFHVDRIVFRWGSVDAYGISLMKDGREFARAESISMRADFLSFLHGTNSISSVSIEKPFVMVSIDKQGLVNLPLAATKKEDGTNNVKLISFRIGKISVNNGRILVSDERLPSGGNSADLKDLNFRCDDLSYPFGDSMSSFSLSGEAEGRIMSGRLNADGRFNPGNGSADFRLKGTRLVLLDFGEKGPLFRAEAMQMAVATMEDKKGRYYSVDDVILKKPYLRYETDEAGDLVSPWKEVMEEISRVSGAGQKKS